MSANGRLLNSELASIGHGYYLRKDAAKAFNAMSAQAKKQLGSEIRVVSAYRPYAKQVELYNLYLRGRGNLAAKPGTSNHGWGLAVDLQLPYGRSAVDRVGAAYGFSKRCSDAPSEAWHVVYNPACTKATFKAPAGDRLLRQGMSGNDVGEVQTYLLRGGYLPKGDKRKGIPPAIDKRFGKRTKDAVIRFQRDNRLTADGIVGPATIKALRAKYKRK